MHYQELDFLLNEVSPHALMDRVLKLTEALMFGWAVFFLIVALIAGILGFGGIANLSMDLAIIVVVVALVLAVISGLVGAFRRPHR